MPQQPLSRRHFVGGAGALGAVTIFAPQALAARGRRQPTLRGGASARACCRATRAPRRSPSGPRCPASAGSGSVELEVARDRGFSRVVARKLIPTSRRHRPRRQGAGGRPRGRTSSTTTASPRGTRTARSGRFRTALPPDSHQTVKFAFFSCQDFTFGYFNAHALLAREDVDFVVNLGDYIYAEAYHQPRQHVGRRAHRPGRRGHDAGRLPGQVPALPQRPQPAARCTPSSR